MEVFVPDRDAAEVLALMGRLSDLGIAGRDAAYLASVYVPVETGTPEMTHFIREFEFMVAARSRVSAASLIGLVRHDKERAATTFVSS
jgi:hypothetical protein